MALPQIKALGLLAVVFSVAGISYAAFFQNSVGQMASIMNLGATGMQTFGALFIVIALFFLYGVFRT